MDYRSGERASFRITNKNQLRRTGWALIQLTLPEEWETNTNILGLWWRYLYDTVRLHQRKGSTVPYIHTTKLGLLLSQTYSHDFHQTENLWTKTARKVYAEEKLYNNVNQVTLELKLVWAETSKISQTAFCTSCQTRFSASLGTTGAISKLQSQVLSC